MNNLGTQVLESERLILRRLKVEDAESIFNGVINQEEFLYYANKTKVTLEQEKQSLERAVKNYENLDYYNWAITTKEDGTIVGLIHLRVIEKNDSVEFSYAVDKSFTGKGYMTEALKLVLDFALNEMKVNRIQGACVTENIASRRVMEKCNMTCEGRLRKYIHLCDGYHDAFMYSLVNWYND